MYLVILDISRISDMFCGGIYLLRHLTIVTERFCYYYIEGIQRPKVAIMLGKKCVCMFVNATIHISTDYVRLS